MKANTRLKLNDPSVKGIFFIVLSALCFATMSFFVKMSGDLPVFQKAFFRNAVAGIVAVILLIRSGEKVKVGKGNRIPLLMRCAFGTAGLLCNFYALSMMNISDANMLNKMAPFFAILLSIPILKEKPNKIDIFCVVVAFLGALFIIKPGQGIASIYALFGLFGGFGAGVAYTYVRKMGLNGVKGPVIVAAFSVFTCIVCAPQLIFAYAPMTTQQFLCLLAAGCAAAIAQLSVTAAYSYAPAKEISVFDYTQVLFAAILGILFLGEYPDVLSIAGYVIIIGIGIFRWYQTTKKIQKG